MSQVLLPEGFYTVEGPPEGFLNGMAREITGYWVGNEKYRLGNETDGTSIVYKYCSMAHFNKIEETETNTLAWISSYAGESEDDCRTMNIDPVTGDIFKNSTFISNVELPFYMYEVNYFQCIPASECNYDITPYLPDGFEVVATACGNHLKNSFLDRSENTCERYQISLVKDN